MALTIVDSRAALSDGSVSVPSLETPVVNWSVPPASGRNRNVNVAVPFAASVGTVQMVRRAVVLSVPPADDVMPSTVTFGTSGSSSMICASTLVNRTPVAGAAV